MKKNYSSNDIGYSNKDWISVSKYLSDELKDGEKEIFESWGINNNEHTGSLNYLKRNWEDMKQINGFHSVDVDTAWDNIKEKIYNSGTTRTKTNFAQYFLLNGLNKKFELVAAACVAILVAISVLFALNNGLYPNLLSKQIVVGTSTEDQTLSTLPDGSVCYLNYNSEISYNKNFSENNTRHITLKGEAFFDVRPNANKPFIVKLNSNVKVKVLGTSFNVITSPKSSKIEVYVKTGKVHIYQGTSPESGIIVEPGHIGRFNGNKFSQELNSDSNYLAWQTKQLRFNNTPLSEVARVLNKVYNCNIVIENPEIEKLTFTTMYSNQPLESVIEVIKTAFNLEAEYSSEKIMLKQK